MTVPAVIIADVTMKFLIFLPENVPAIILFLYARRPSAMIKDKS